MLDKLKINKKLIIPVVVAAIAYLLAYYIPKFVIDYNKIHILTSDLDRKIKLFSPFVIIYFGSYLQWINCLLIVAKQETKLGYKMISTLIIGSLIGMIVFLVYPTGVERPEIIPITFFDYLVEYLYKADTIANACPSFHCFCSALVVLALLKCKDIKKGTLIFNTIFSILVFASTLLTKQHVITDVFCGIALAIICSYITNHFTFTKLFEKLNSRFIK